METLFSLLTLAGIGYGMYRGIKWLMHSNRSASPGEEPLTPRDLKVLEEAAARLMADMKAAADECVARVEAACERAERITAMRPHVPVPEGPGVQIPDLPRSADSPGLLTGEIELVRGLQQIARS